MLSYFRKLRRRFALLSQHEQIVSLFFLYALLFATFQVFMWSAPTGFPHYSIIRIKEGTSLNETSQILYQKNIIRSTFWYKSFSVLLGGSRSIKAGDYYFNTRENVVGVAHRIIKGYYGLVPIRITIPEGLSVFQIAPIYKEKLQFFDEQQFITDAPEGYLFPDTYFFLPNASTEDVINRMRKNFEDKIEPLKNDFASSTIPFDQIITIASILEEEAIKKTDKKIISGIIRNRLAINMPLQVDATFSYVNGKNTYTLTRTDLKDDSPYNTYTNKGLPPGPIANPGIEAIEAALYPEKTDYLYFLSDLRGKMYYAKNFDGHQRNRELYLRK